MDCLKSVSLEKLPPINQLVTRIFAAFADTLDRLSQLTWAEISKSHRHGLGYEMLRKMLYLLLSDFMLKHQW